MTYKRMYYLITIDQRKEYYKTYYQQHKDTYKLRYQQHKLKLKSNEISENNKELSEISKL